MRGLVELTAKALGLTGYVVEGPNGASFIVPSNPEIPRSYPKEYDWLNDDGDSRRLQIALGLELIFDDPLWIVVRSNINEHSEVISDTPDCAGIRVAFVKLAAAIGGRMK